MSIQSEIARFGNGVGYIYITDSHNNIVSTMVNNVINKRLAQQVLSVSSPVSSEIAATGTITLTSGSGTITNLTVASVSIFDTTVPITGGSLSALATNAATAINAFISSPDYIAVAVGPVIYLTVAPGNGSSLNNSNIAGSLTGTLAATYSLLDGGTASSDITDSKSGYKIYLNTSSSAALGDLTNATDVTVQIMLRGVNSAPITNVNTVTSGSLSPTRDSFITEMYVYPAGGPGSANLDTITTTGYNDGDIIQLVGYNSSNVIVVRDNAVGGGNIKLANASTFSTAGKEYNIFLQYRNTSTTQWYEVFRSPGLSFTVSNFRAASIPQAASGTIDRILTTGGGTISLTPGTDKGYQVILGTGTLSGSWVIQGTGSPIDGDKFLIDYRATFTKGANNITIFGISLTATQALSGNIMIQAVYDAASTSYRAKIYTDATSRDFVDTTQLATKETGLGNPAADGFILASTISGTRSWVSPANTSIFASFTTTVTDGGTSTDQDQYVAPVVAGTLTTNGQSLTFDFVGNSAANANAKTLKVKFGTNVLATNSTTTSPNNKNFFGHITLMRVAPDTIKAMGSITFDGVAPQIFYTQVTGLNLSATSYDFKVCTNTGSLGDLNLYEGLVIKNFN